MSRSTSTVIYLVNDYLEIASTFRSNGMTIRNVYPDDAQSRHEILTNITQGGVMGVIIGLKGPQGTAKDVNASRRRHTKNIQQDRDGDTRRQARVHAYLAEIIQAIQACDGFIILMASPRNNAWQYFFVQSFLRSVNCTSVEVHACRILGTKDYCMSIRVATTIPVDANTVQSTHAEDCCHDELSRDERKARRIQALQRNREERTVESRKSEISEPVATVRNLGKALAQRTLIPVLRQLCFGSDV